MRMLHPLNPATRAHTHVPYAGWERCDCGRDHPRLVCGCCPDVLLHLNPVTAAP